MQKFFAHIKKIQSFFNEKKKEEEVSIKKKEVVLTRDRYTVPQKVNENTPSRCLYSFVQLIVNMSESITDLIEISNQAELSSYLLYKKS